ncbi:hypothetical protein SDC9_190454 [bioreactor metagenome]|uniref:Uncharacterized protein n=1 Tax=bioreactor metagenome TaxID=1076179 RepID=A0A645HWE2_9ZZZZ
MSFRIPIRFSMKSFARSSDTPAELFTWSATRGRRSTPSGAATWPLTAARCASWRSPAGRVTNWPSTTVRRRRWLETSTRCFTATPTRLPTLPSVSRRWPRRKTRRDCSATGFSRRIRCGSSGCPRRTGPSAAAAPCGRCWSF